MVGLHIAATMSNSCRSFSTRALSSLLRPSPPTSSSNNNSSLLPLPFLYATRSISGSTAHRFSPRSTRSNPTETNPEIDEDLPFIASDAAPANPSTAEDPWAYLHSPSAAAAAAAEPPLLPTNQYRRSRANRLALPLMPGTERMTPQNPLTRRRTRFSVDVFDAPRSYVNNTVTQREREIFTQIFDQILSPNAAAAASPPVTGEPDEFGSRTVPLAPALASLLGSAPASGVSFTPPRPKPVSATVEATARNLSDPSGERLRALRAGLAACKDDVAALNWLDEKLFTLPGTPDQDLYPELLVSALSVFQRRFGDLEAVITLFERAKRLGADAYVLGCGSRVYNRVINVTWKAHGDIERVRALVEEMRVHAVEGDWFTVRDVRKIVDDVKRARRGEKDGLVGARAVTDGDAESAWWVEEEMARIEARLQMGRERVMAAAARASELELQKGWDKIMKSQGGGGGPTLKKRGRPGWQDGERERRRRGNDMRI